MCRCFLYVIITIVNCRLAMGQSPGNEKEFSNWQASVAVIASRSLVRDKYFDANSFRGITMGGSAGITYSGERLSHLVVVEYLQGKLHQEEQQFFLNQKNLSLSYFSLYKIFSLAKNKLIAEAGVQAGAFYSRRNYSGYINRVYSGESAIHIAPALRFSYNLSGDNLMSLSIKNRISVPGLTYIKTIRTEKTERIEFDSPRIAGPGDFCRINNYLEIEKMISDRHRVSIFYNWDYYTVENGNGVSQANHKLGLSYIYNL